MPATARRQAPVSVRAGGRGLVRGASSRAVGLVVALAALVVAALLSLAIGAKSIPLGTVVDAFTDYNAANGDESIVRSLRGPRTVIGLLVGVALGLAGTVMQGLTRNPLADPGILGVNAGAALGLVMGIYLFGIEGLGAYVWFGFAGAAIASVAVYTIGSLGREGATPVKLALAGAALTAFLTSFTSLIGLLDRESFEAWRFWVVGSLAGRDSDIAGAVWPFILGGTLMAFACGRVLNVLSLGEDVARSLGQNVVRARAFAAVAIVLLCGAATAAAGPIWFVGLVVPHIARAITGPDYRWILAYSVVLAPTLLLLADVIGRVAAPPGELQVGIVLALVGAPFFIALVRRRKLAEL